MVKLNLNNYLIVGAVILIVLSMVLIKKREYLSLSQWLPSKEDCSQFIRKPDTVLPPYPKNTVIDCGLPGDRRLRLKNCSFYNTYSPGEKCSSCCPKPLLEPDCQDFKEADVLTALNSPSTPGLNLPKVSTTLIPVYEGKIGDLTKKQVSEYLEAGHLIASANTKTQLHKLVRKLQLPNGNGYPNFTKIDGPVVYLKKDNGIYYYGIDYCSKWNPPQIHNYVNATPYTNYAFLAYESGAQLLEPCYPVVVLASENSENQKTNPEPVNSPKLEKAECCKSVWGSPFGCGNWTSRV